MKGTLARPKKRPSPASRTRRSSRTELGGVLRKIRADIVSSGVPLLDWDALDREIAERRGDKNGESHR
jgi:hypothetical protein